MLPPNGASSSLHQDATLVQYVDDLITEAIEKFASDIHIEPYEDFTRIRFRQDGILIQIRKIPAALALRCITRLKVMAKLDITEKRMPQDGRITRNTFDIRMNTCPTFFGEKIVLRLLDTKTTSLDLSALGLTPMQSTLLLQKINQPYGLILVTGPTGSGKTLTLYSMIQHRNHPEVNISTVEDPVEIQLPGVNQVNVNLKIGLDFANILRALLRQDPDIIMIGEIRDEATAKIALQAANTGHLVLATLHTNSALEALNRLSTLGITFSHMANALSLIINQRLLRKLCPHCKRQDNKNYPELHHFTPIYTNHQCQNCLAGYKGRTGIYELLAITPALCNALKLHLKPQIFAKLTYKAMETLQMCAWHKVKAGITSMHEIQRVLINE